MNKASPWFTHMKEVVWPEGTVLHVTTQLPNSLPLHHPFQEPGSGAEWEAMCMFQEAPVMQGG